MRQLRLLKRLTGVNIVGELEQRLPQTTSSEQREDLEIYIGVFRGSPKAIFRFAWKSVGILAVIVPVVLTIVFVLAVVTT